MTRSAGAIPRRGGRLRRLPHRGPEGRRDLRRRPRAEDALRHVLRTQSHAARPTRASVAGREADFVRAMREGVRPDGAHYYPAFPYRRSRGSATAISPTSGLTCAACRRTAGQPGAPAALPVRLALCPARLEVAVLHARPVRGRWRAHCRRRPRRLPGRGPRSLRRMPHAAQSARRCEARAPPRGWQGAHRQGRPESDAHAARRSGTTRSSRNTW